MAGVLDVNIVSVTLPGAADVVTLFRAPSDGDGGGITVVNAYARNFATTSGTATFTAALVKGGTALAFAANGTIGTLGGTASHWTDGTDKQFTIDTDYAFMDAGEALAIAYAAVDGGSHTRGQVDVHYIQGRRS